MFKKVITYSIAAVILCIPFFTFAQYSDSTTVILNPYGEDYREPKIYGTGYIAPAPNPVITPADTAQLPVVDNTDKISTKENVITSPTNLFEIQKKSTGFFDKLSTTKLKIDVFANNKNCLINGERSIPWTFANNGVDIDTVDELKATIDQAMQADKRLRRVTIRENILDMYYLQPARIFGIIPINYMLKTSIDIDTFQVTTSKTNWHAFARTFHSTVANSISDNSPRIFTPDNISYVQKQNIYYKHSFTITAISSILNTVQIYPFANSFWICTIVPYFVVFLLLFGMIFGFLFYIWAKRKKDRYIRRFKNGDFNRHKLNKDSVLAPTSQFRELPKINDDQYDDDSLEDYVKSKRFK